MPFGSLWLPGVVSAVAVFLLSSVVHMVLRYHRADYRKLADEEAVAEGLRKGAPSPGLYMIPHGDLAQMKDPAFLKRFEEGPVAILAVVRKGKPNMGKNLSQWFLFCLLVSFVTAYVARHVPGLGTDSLNVLRITATVAFVGYGFGYFQDAIWKGIPWANSLRGFLDALLYGLATGLVFRLLWPAA